MGWSPERRNAPDAWYAEPGFVAAHVDRIRAAAATLPDADPSRTVVLYSAHSLPVKTVVTQEDPYPRHIEETVKAIDAALPHRYRSRLGYQSKVGPVEWLGPSTPDVLQDLAKAGEKQVLVVPIAFVSDHVETLYEIRLLFGGLAARLGIPHYAVAEGLNDHPEFIRGLVDVVEKAAA
jgi:ferrochelatase